MDPGLRTIDIRIHNESESRRAVNHPVPRSHDVPPWYTEMHISVDMKTCTWGTVNELIFCMYERSNSNVGTNQTKKKLANCRSFKAETVLIRSGDIQKKRAKNEGRPCSYTREQGSDGSQNGLERQSIVPERSVGCRVVPDEMWTMKKPSK